MKNTTNNTIYTQWRIIIAKRLLQTLCCICLGMFITTNLYADRSKKNIKNEGWTEKHYGGDETSFNDLYLNGCSDCRGAFDDEYALTANIARTFNERGGYFCPTQIESANNDGHVWFDFWNMLSPAPCKWICIDGYTGENCAQIDNGSDIDTTSILSLKKGKVLTVNQPGYFIPGPLDVFHNLDDTNMSFLAIVKYLEHGVVVARLTVQLDWNSGATTSWISASRIDKTTLYLLCAQGYKRNNNDTDCIQIDPNAIPRPWCTGFTSEEYNANVSEFEIFTDDTQNCKRYRCSDQTKAFASNDVNDHKCVECVDNPARGGADKFGICTKCPTGQVFDRKESARVCKPATKILSKSDLQYGQQKNKNSVITEQCWTHTDSTEYKNCVFGKQNTKQDSVNRFIKNLKIRP